MWHIVFHISCERFEHTNSREMKFFKRGKWKRSVGCCNSFNKDETDSSERITGTELASCCWLSHFMWITQRRVYSVRSTISKTFTCESTAASPIVIIYRMKEKSAAQVNIYFVTICFPFIGEKKEGPWKTKKKVKALRAISVNNYLGWFLYRLPQWGKFYFFHERNN